MRSAHPILFILVVLGLIVSCSKPNYNADPSGNNNDLYNPYSTSPVNYNWMNNSSFSANVEVNGNTTYWTSDGTGTFQYNYGGGYNEFSGVSSSGAQIVLEFTGMYPGNTEKMGWNNGSQYLGYLQSAMVPSHYIYWSYLTLPKITGTGGIKLVQNDTFAVGVSGYIRGMFFGQVTDSVGRIAYISNGVFNYQKW